MNRCGTIAMIAAAMTGAPALAGSFDVFTDFEFTDLDGFFQLGSSPNSVQFINGQAKTIGAPLLYTSGLNAWMVDVGETAEILFETPAASVDLWYRDQSQFTTSVMTFFDPDDNMIAQFNGTVTMFQNIQVSGIGPIARITLANNGQFGYAVIDDFGFTAIPGPAGAALFGLAGLGLMRRRRA